MKAFGLLIIGFLTTTGLVLASPATFKTPGGSVDSPGGDPVSAQAVLTPGNGTIGIVLTNLQANIKDAGQLLTDLYFDIVGLTPSSPTGTESGTTITINSTAAGDFTFGAAINPEWGITTATGPLPSTGIHLDGLSKSQNVTCEGNGQACFGIIGGPDGSNAYAAAGGSIAGNTAHNPFINQSLSFSLSVSGVTASSTFSNVYFSFGTTSGDNILGNIVPTPEPRFVSLLLLGFLLTLGVCYRKKASVQ